MGEEWIVNGWRLWFGGGGPRAEPELWETGLFTVVCARVQGIPCLHISVAPRLKLTLAEPIRVPIRVVEALKHMEEFGTLEDSGCGEAT